MKKKYITPETFVVCISIPQMIAHSVGTSETPLDNGDALVKENASTDISNVNLWDSEW